MANEKKCSLFSGCWLKALGCSSILVAFTLIGCALIMFLNAGDRNSRTNDKNDVLKHEHYVMESDTAVNDSIFKKYIFQN